MMQLCLCASHSHPGIPIPDWARAANLAPRQQQIAACLAIGLSAHQTADVVHLRYATVRSYIKQVYQRLGVRSRSELASRILSEMSQVDRARLEPDVVASSAWVREFSLSPRLARAAACLALGLSDKQIAERLSIRYHTARKYVRQLGERLQCPAHEVALRNRIQLLGRVIFLMR